MIAHSFASVYICDDATIVFYKLLLAGSSRRVGLAHSHYSPAPTSTVFKLLSYGSFVCIMSTRRASIRCTWATICCV